MYLFLIVISFFQLIQVEWFSFSIVLLFLLIFVRFLFIRNKVRLGLAGFIYVTYLELTFFLLPLFVNNPPGELSYLKDLTLLNPTMDIGFILLILIYAANLKLSNKKRYLWFRSFDYKRANAPKLIPYLLLVMMFLSSHVSSLLGITAMGSKVEVELPFKIVGLLNVLRIYIFPYICFLIFVLLSEKKAVKPLVIFTVLFIAWTLFESYLRVSKGVFIRNLLPMFLFLILSRVINIKRGMVTLAVVAPIFILIFLSGDTIRQLNFLKRDITVENVIARTQHRLSLNPNVFYFYQRIFPTGIEVMKYQNFDPSLFHLKISHMIKYRGSPEFHTRVLDKVDRNGAGRFHSSGIGGVSDGFFWAGLPGLIICGWIFFGLFFFIDHLLSDYALKSMLMVFSFDLLFGGVGLFSYVFFGTVLLRLVFPFCLCLHGFCIWKQQRSIQ